MILHYNTITPLLKEILLKLMRREEFAPFRLVGGTALSLQLGHRVSIDIDLFTDAEYESVDFDSIENYLYRAFSYVDTPSVGKVSFGKSYYIGKSKEECVKLDLFYADPFIRPALFVDSIRMASVEEIAAMKIDVIQRGGRKKDFWDIHQILELYDLAKLLSLHKERYTYTHEHDQIVECFKDFRIADSDFDPICLQHKIWEIIKLDIIDTVVAYKSCH